MQNKDKGMHFLYTTSFRFFFNKIPVKLTDSQNTHAKREPPKDTAQVNFYAVFKHALGNENT